MSYRTMLVHCNDKRRIEKLLAPTIGLAEEFQAHVIGLSIVPPVAVMSMGIPDGPPIVIDDHCKLYREESLAMKVAFETAARGRTFVSEWRDDEADAFGVADRILQYARSVDLVIAAQTDPDRAGTEGLDVADRLAMESGRPVLIIPNAGAHAGVGEKVLVAWNARREAACGLRRATDPPARQGSEGRLGQSTIGTRSSPGHSSSRYLRCAGPSRR